MDNRNEQSIYKYKSNTRDKYIPDQLSQLEQDENDLLDNLVDSDLELVCQSKSFNEILQNKKKAGMEFNSYMKYLNGNMRTIIELESKERFNSNQN